MLGEYDSHSGETKKESVSYLGVGFPDHTCCIRSLFCSRVVAGRRAGKEVEG
jgi:hypothetical protein